jgi:hypothetical protein
LVFTLLNLFKQFNQEFMVEGEGAEEDAVEGDPQRPHVALLAVVALLEHLAEHLGSHEVVGTLAPPQFLLTICQFNCPPEIDYLDLKLTVNENVLRFDVPMHNIVGMH